MPRFSSAPVQEVAPKRKQRQPSQRAQIQRQYQDALRNAIQEKHEALVVELEPGDKPLTIRNRIKRAAERLGMEHIVIRRKRQRIMAYEPEIVAYETGATSQATQRQQTTPNQGAEQAS